MRTNNLTISLLCLFFLIIGGCLSLIGCGKKIIHADRTGIVEGFVKDSLDMTPVVGADVFLDDHPYDPQPKTDSAGYYKVVTLLGAPELIKITIKAQGYKTQDKTIIIKPSQTQSLDFFLVKEGGA